LSEYEDNKNGVCCNNVLKYGQRYACMAFIYCITGHSELRQRYQNTFAIKLSLSCPQQASNLH